MMHAPQATVVVSQHGLESVEGHYHQPWNFRAVKTGERIPIGKNELVFIEAPMLHWPDSMFTYLTGHNILMPNDAFGQHYATAGRFSDEADPCELQEEALKYYANILTPFSSLVTRKIGEVLALNLPVSMICPSHGVLWRKDPLAIVKQYQAWAQQVPEKRAVLIYDSMWQGTHKMAEAIGAGLQAEGVPFKLFPMAVSDRNDVIVEIFRAKAVLVGSPTLNNGLMPTITPILEDLRGLKFKNKIGAAFGSYGWSGEHVALIEQHFDKCHIPIAAPGLRVKWQPKPADLMACDSFGRTIAQAVKKD
jgi:flavorubredoxin